MNFLLVGCFNQLDVLLSKRAQLEQDVPLGTEDIEIALQKLQHWLQSYVTWRDVDFVCGNLLALSEAANVVEPISFRHSASTPRSPSSHDAKVPVGETRDDSVDFFVLETMHLMFTTLSSDSKNAPTETQFLILDDVVAFCMQKLHHDCSPAVQHTACLCLSTLSGRFLDILLPKFNERLAAAKKETDIREYTSYHKAVTLLQFGAATNLGVLLEYLGEMVQLAKKVERGVLRAEICKSWAAIFEGVLKSRDVDQSAHAVHFWELFEAVFALVLKWSQRQKHGLFCHELLTKMVALQPKSDFVSNHKRVWKWLVDGLSQETRKHCLDLLLFDIKALPSDALRSGILKDALLLDMAAKLLPKKFSSPSDEHAVTTNILIEMIRQHDEFALTKMFIPVLRKSASHSSSQKAILLKALGVGLKDFIAPDCSHVPTLTPMVINQLEEFNKDAEVLSAALSCIPYLHLTDYNKVAKSIFRLTIHSDRGTSTAALFCLKNMALRNPATSLFYIVHGLVDMLKAATHLRVDQSRLHQCCDNLAFILQVFEEFVTKTPDVSTMSRTECTALRRHVEGVVLMAMCHHEGRLRREALSALLLISKPTLRQFEASNHAPFLAAEFVRTFDPVSLPISTEVFHLELENLLKSERRVLFSDVLSYAWSAMCGVTSELCSEDLLTFADNSEHFNLFHNQVYFLCLAFGTGTLRTQSPSEKKEFLDLDAASMDACPGSVKCLGFVKQLLDFLRKNVDVQDRSSVERLTQSLMSNLGAIHVSGYPILLRELNPNNSLPIRLRGARGMNFPQIITRLFLRDNCGSCPEAIKYAADVVGSWLIEDFLLFESLPVEVRSAMVACIQRALQFHHEGKIVLLEENKDGPIKLALRLLTRPGFTRTEQDYEGEYGTGIDRALCELANLGPFRTDGLANKMIGVMHEMAMDASTELRAKIAQQAFQNFLQSHPLYLSHFLKMSTFDIHGQDPRIPKKHISLFYFTAIVQNWIGLTPTDVTADIVPKMLVVSLIHQISFLPEARFIALQLARKLASALFVPFSIKLVTPPSFSLYYRAALQYSEALASNPVHFKLIPFLLSEIVPSFGYLSDLSRNHILELLLPWISNVAPLLSHLVSEQSDTQASLSAVSILTSLLDITRSCFVSSVCATNQSRAWKNVMRCGSRKFLVWFVPEVVGFLEQRYKIAHASSSDRHLIRTVFTYICRSSCGQQIVDTMMERFREYPEFPGTLSNRKWKLQPLTIEEHAAFELLVDVVFENVELFLAHVPRLLMTARVITAVDASFSQQFLRNFAAGLFFELDELDQWSSVMKYLAKQMPSALEGWYEVCLGWVCYSLDSILVTQALLLLPQLQREMVRAHPEVQVLARLEFVLFEFLQTGLHSGITHVIPYFELDPSSAYTQTTFMLCMSAGRALLEYNVYFSAGCRIISRALSPQLETCNWFGELDKGRAFWAPDGTNADQAIAALIFRGLVVKSTFLNASLLAAKLVANASHPENGLVVISLLTGFISCFVRSGGVTNTDLEMQAALLQMLQICTSAERSPLKKSAFSAMAATFSTVHAAIRENLSESIEEQVGEFFLNFHACFAESNDFSSIAPLVEHKTLCEEKRQSPVFTRHPSILGSYSPKGTDHDRRLFRASLRSGINRPKDPKIELEVPVLCYKCVEFLKLHLETVGLFRVPGDSTLIQKLKAQFEHSLPVELTEPNAVAGVLKLYLRELSESLLPEWMYSKIMSVDDAKTLQEKLNIVRAMCQQLPAENRLLLRYLLEFFLMVAAKSSVNKMDVRNLAMVFAPNLNRPPTETITPRELVRETAIQQKLIEFLMEHYFEIFEETLDPKTPRRAAKQANKMCQAASENPPSVLFSFVTQLFSSLLNADFFEWRFVMLTSFRAFLQCSPDTLTAQQTQDLGEVVMLCYDLQDKEVLRAAEDFARVLARKASDALDPVFNFLRPRRQQSQAEYLFQVLEDEQEKCAVFVERYGLLLIHDVLSTHESGKRLSSFSTLSVSSRDSVAIDDGRMSQSSGRKAPPPPPMRPSVEEKTMRSS